MNKRNYAIIAVMALMITAITPVLAVKPETNLAGSQKVAWNLSGDVMPPPYGAKDNPGSDAKSKLLVNQPKGAVEAALTGVMKGLKPNLQYTVYLAKGYTPYHYTGWNIEGDWTILAAGGYSHDYTFVQDGTTITGTGGYPAGADPYTITETVTGTIDPMTGEINLHVEYNESNYWYDAELQVQPDGTIVGTFGGWNGQSGLSWVSTSGTATDSIGDTWYPGPFTSTIKPFTFVTDDDGCGSWHLNLRDNNFSGPGIYSMSVWINEPGATVLISDTFTVEVE